MRSKWKKHRESSLQPGELVLVKEDNTSSHSWISERILSIHPASDGHYTTATTERAARRSLLMLRFLKENRLSASSTLSLCVLVNFRLVLCVSYLVNKSLRELWRFYSSEKAAVHTFIWRHNM